MKMYMNIVSLALLAITGATADGSHGTRASKTDMAEQSGGLRSSPAHMAEQSGGAHHPKAEMAERSGGAYRSKAEIMAERSGGLGESTCSDVSGWTAQSGKSVSAKTALYACFNFQNDDDCSSNIGNLMGTQDLTANDACCACGGGVIAGSAPTTCSDVIGWYDSDGADYDCDWYGQENNCANHGGAFENEGLTANGACCACGGGVVAVSAPTTCSDVSGWTAQSGKSVSAKTALYACFNFQNDEDCSSNIGNLMGTQDLTANGACCACGGGVVAGSVPTSTCSDVIGWYDSDGADFDCDWYGQDNNCANHGGAYENEGLTANGACCACGGGGSDCQVSGTTWKGCNEGFCNDGSGWCQWLQEHPEYARDPITSTCVPAVCAGSR